MNTEIQTLPLPATDATAGNPVDVTTLRDATIYVHQPAGGASFSLKVQAKIASPDLTEDHDDDWVDLTTAITAPALVPLAVGGVPVTVTHLRVYRTTIATGAPAPAVVYAGRR